MTGVIIVSVVFTAIILAMAIASFTILAVMRRRHGGLKEKDKGQWNEETRMIQEMHDEMTKMEGRIEALETILMDDSGKDRQ